MNFFEEHPEIQRLANQLTEETLNSPMILDIKDDPRLAYYKFYLDNNPTLIPAALMFYYTYVINNYPDESIDVDNIISDNPESFEKTTLINLIKSEINLHIRNSSRLANEIRDPSDELVEAEEPGIELKVRPVEAIPVDLPINMIEATILPNEEITNPNLPTARQIGGKTKKRKDKYKKATNKKHKKIKQSYNKFKNNKNNKKTLRKKS